MIDSAVSSGVSAPRSRPIGALRRASSSSVMPRASEPLAALLLGAARAHRAHVRGVGAQRDAERGVVELGVVREHGDRRRAIDAADALEGLLRPRGDDLLGVGEAVRAREEAARVDDVGPPAARARQRAQLGGEVDGAEDDQPRRREGDVDEQVPALLGALGPHELVGVARGLVVELGRAQRAAPAAVGLEQHLRSGVRALEDRDDRAAAVLAGDLGEAPLRRQLVVTARSARPRRRSRRRTAARRPTPLRRRCRSSAAAERRRP